MYTESDTFFDPVSGLVLDSDEDMFEHLKNSKARAVIFDWDRTLQHVHETIRMVVPKIRGHNSGTKGRVCACVGHLSRRWYTKIQSTQRHVCTHQRTKWYMLRKPDRQNARR